MNQKFISPYHYQAPAGAEGWQGLYRYYMVFQENLKQAEERRANSRLGYLVRVTKVLNGLIVRIPDQQWTNGGGDYQDLKH